MTRTQLEMVTLARGVDRAILGPARYLVSHRRLRTTVLGMGVAAALAIAMIPVRDTVGAANIALALVIVVGFVGSAEGLAPGLVAAFWASGLFTLLHAVPHGNPLMEEGQDVLTATLLVGAGAMSGWAHGVTTRLQHRLQFADHDLRRLHGLAELALEDLTVDEVMTATTNRLRATLDLQDCYWERIPSDDRWRELRHSGLINGGGSATDRASIGALLREGVAISMGSRGRLVLRGRPGVDPTSRQLKVAIVMADLAAAACGGHTSEEPP